MTLEVPVQTAPLGPAGKVARTGTVKMDRPTRAILLVVCVILALIVVVPTTAVLASGLTTQGISAIGTMATSTGGRQALWNTLQLGVLTAVIGTALGFCLAFAEVRLRFFGRRALHVLALLPIVSFAAGAVVIALGMRGSATLGAEDRKSVV